MSLDTGVTDGAPDATATPAPPVLDDAQKSALEAAGVDLETYELYVNDQAGYHKHQNRRSMDIAEDKVSDAIGRLGDGIKAAVSSNDDEPPAAPQLAIPQEVFAQLYGIEDDAGWQQPASMGQVFDALNRLAHMGTNQFKNVVGELPLDAENPVTLAGLHAALNETRQVAQTGHETLKTMLGDAALAGLSKKYPRARESEIIEAMKNAPLDKFMEHVEKVAKRSHDEVQGTLDEELAAQRRELVPEPAFTGAGGGAAATGDSPPNPWSDPNADLSGYGDV